MWREVLIIMRNVSARLAVAKQELRWAEESIKDAVARFLADPNQSNFIDIELSAKRYMQLSQEIRDIQSGLAGPVAQG